MQWSHACHRHTVCQMYTVLNTAPHAELHSHADLKEGCSWEPQRRHRALWEHWGDYRAPHQHDGWEQSLTFPTMCDVHTVSRTNCVCVLCMCHRCVLVWAVHLISRARPVSTRIVGCWSTITHSCTSSSTIACLPRPSPLGLHATLKSDHSPCTGSLT